jgi:hypothetical protein
MSSETTKTEKLLLFQGIIIIILPVVLYGCKIWSLTLSEEHRLRVFEKRVLRRIYGPKRDEVTGEWRSCTMRSFIFYTPPQILLGRSSQRD